MKQHNMMDLFSNLLNVMTIQVKIFKVIYRINKNQFSIYIKN